MSRSRIARAFVALLTLITLLAPTVAAAATPYGIDWQITEYADSCETATLSGEGLNFFEVNQVPLPTYTVPGSQTTNYDGSTGMKAEAPFQSVLLHTGANDFLFQVSIETGDNSCVDAHEVVTLGSPALSSPKPLFDVKRVGTAYVGNTSLSLALTEVNPPLARDIANLEKAIASERQGLVDNASKIANLAAKESVLQELDTELTDLVNRPLDDVSRVDLDAILARYADVVDPATKAALENLIDDLKKSVADLQTELNGLLDNFGAQATAAADAATAAARASGWNPDDPSSYQLGDGSVPVVDVPDISDTPGAFSPGNDPYDAYASKVINQLQSDVVDGVVSNRGDFVANVRAWRANEAALQAALAKRSGVSQAEDGAFLRGQARVTAFVRKFMSATDWYSDTAVPGTLQAYVDGILKDQFPAAADRLKDELNLWPPRVLSPGEQAFADMINSFAGGVSAIASVMGDMAEVSQIMGTIVITAARVGVGFIPVVGEVLDLCEAVTGKAWCIPGGVDLTPEERLFSAVGFGVGAYWRGAKAASTGAGAIRTADEAARLVETPIGKGLKIFRLKQWRNLRAAVSDIANLNDFEKAVAQNIQSRGHTFFGVGEDGIASVLQTQRNLPGNFLPDFISISKGNSGLLITEAKGLEGGVAIDVEHCLAKFDNTATKLKGLGYAGDVNQLEIAMPKGAGFQPGKLGSDGIPRAFSLSGDQLMVTEAGVTKPMRNAITGLVIHVVQL